MAVFCAFFSFQIRSKQQHNFKSAGKSYFSRDFVPIEHEYIMVLKKPELVTIIFQWPKNYKMDVRDSKCATWTDIVYAALKTNGGRMTLNSLYKKIDGHKKCQNNRNWQAKVRQTLQLSKRFERVERGVWQIAV